MLQVYGPSWIRTRDRRIMSRGTPWNRGHTDTEPGDIRVQIGDTGTRIASRLSPDSPQKSPQ